MCGTTKTMMSMNEKGSVMPADTIGRIVYAAKEFGPVTLLASVMVWQSIKLVGELREDRNAVLEEMKTERLEHLKYNRELTQQVVEGLNGSTSAIADMARQAEKLQTTIEGNSNNIADNTEAVLNNGEQLKKNCEQLRLNGEEVKKLFRDSRQ